MPNVGTSSSSLQSGQPLPSSLSTQWLTRSVHFDQPWKLKAQALWLLEDTRSSFSVSLARVST